VSLRKQVYGSNEYPNDNERPKEIHIRVYYFAKVILKKKLTAVNTIPIMNTLIVMGCGPMGTKNPRTVPANMSFDMSARYLETASS